MKPWKDLSMKERGAFIRVGVKNGITSVDGIRDAYNKFAYGGHKFDDGGPKLTPEEQYQEMVEAKMMSAPLLRFGDERGSWRWSRNLGAEAYMPEIEVVAENKSGKSTTKRGEQPTAIKNERLTEEEKKEEEEFWTGQRNSEPEMAVTRRPEGYWREQGLKAPILSTGRPADEPIDWQGTGYNHSPEYQKAMSQYRIANMTPEQRWAMTDDQMFKGEVLNAGMGIMMAPAFNPIASIGSGIMDLKYNKNKDWTNYVGDALAIGLPIAGTALNAPTYYRNVQNLYNQGRRVYDMYKYLESLPTSYTGVPQSKVAQLEAVRAGKIPRTFNVWTSDNKLLGKQLYAKRNGITNGKLYKVRDLNRNRYMLDTPRAKDYGEGVNAVSWYNLPYDVQTTPNGRRLVDLPNSKIEIDYAPQNTIRERLTGKTRTYAASKHGNTTDLILYKASRIPNNQGVIFNDITDGTITSVFKLPFEKYHRVIHWDTPIIKERVYNPKAQLLLTPNEPTWMSAWRYRNNQGLRNRMLMEKGYKPDKIFSPQELRKNIMNASYARGGRLVHKFDGTSEPTQRLYQNSQGNLLSQDQYDELVWRAKNNADIAAVNDYREVRVPIRQQQPVDDRMFEGNLNEITVRPDIAYNSDVRNIPALETTEEPLSDEIRKRFANSVGQQRRQAQMTPAEQWANYYTNLANLSYEDRLALENDRKFKRFIGGVAGGTMLGPAAMAAATDLGPPIASWVARKAVPWVTKKLLPKYLNPGWIADQTVSGLGKWATRRGYTALASGLEDIAGVEGMNLFGASSLPGSIINGTLGVKFGYDALNSFIQTPPWSPDRTVGQTFWDTLGLMGGVGTMMEGAPAVFGMPEAIANKLRPFKIIGNYTGEKELFKQEYGEKLGNFLFKQKKKLDYRRLGQAMKHAQEYEITQNATFKKQDARARKSVEWLKKDNRRLVTYGSPAHVETENQHGVPYSLTVLKGKIKPEKHGLSSILFSKASPENQVKYLKKYLGFYLKDHPSSPLADYEVKIVNGRTAIVPKSGTGDAITTIEKSEIPIWGKDINKKSVPYELKTTVPADNGIYFLTGETINQLSDGFTKEIPEEAITALLKFQTKVGEALKGIPMGSSVLVTNGVPLSVHDIDLVALDYLADQNEILAQVRLGGRTGVTKTIKIGVDGEAGKVGFQHEKGMYTGSNPSEHDFSSVDINYILTEEGNDGKRHLLSGLKKVPIYDNNHNQVGSAVVHNNPIAETLYKMYYPEEYQQQLQDIVLHMNKADWPGTGNETLSSFGVPFKRFDENGNLVELSPEELFQKLKEDPMVYTIWNSLDTAYWLPHKGKHTGRIFDIIQYGNPQSVARGLRTWATTKLGGSKNYIAPPNFAEMGFFDDPVKNKWLLKQMGYKFDISNDPQRMQNAFEAYYNDAAILYRGIGIGPNAPSGGVGAFVPDAFDSPENLLKALRSSINEWNGGIGGIGNGVGTNAVKGSNTYGELGFYFMLPSELDKANSIEDAWRILQKNTGNKYKLTQADLDAMPTVAKIKDVKVGTDSQQLLDAITEEMRDRQNMSLDFYNKVDAELHSNGMYALSRTPDRSSYVQGATYVTSGNNSAGDRFAMAAKRAQFDPDFLTKTKLGDIQVPLDRRMADYTGGTETLKALDELGKLSTSIFIGPAEDWGRFFPNIFYGETYEPAYGSTTELSEKARELLRILGAPMDANEKEWNDIDYFRKYLLGAGQFNSKEEVMRFLEKSKTLPGGFGSIYESVIDNLRFNSGMSKEEVEEGIMEIAEHLNKVRLYTKPYKTSNKAFKDYIEGSNAEALARNKTLINKNRDRIQEAQEGREVTYRRASRLYNKASYRKAAIEDRANTVGKATLVGEGLVAAGHALNENHKNKQRRRINRASTSIDKCQDNLRDAYLSGKIDADEYREYMDKLNQYRTQIIGGYLDNGVVDRVGIIDMRYDIDDIQRHIKSHGGPLELNDQYGIGKYINY